MAKRVIKPILVAEGADYRIFFVRNEGYELHMAATGLVGTFDKLLEALEYRDQLTRRQILAGVA